MRPRMYTDWAKADTQKWLSDNNIKNYIMIQFTGGQTPIGWDPNNQYISSNAGRNYHPYFSQSIVNVLNEKFPDHTIIDASMPNEPGYAGSIKCDKSFPVLHELLKKAKGKQKESQSKAKGKPKESKRKAKGKRKESQRKAKGKLKESERKAKGQLKESRRKAKGKLKESRRKDKGKLKES